MTHRAVSISSTRQIVEVRPVFPKTVHFLSEIPNLLRRRPDIKLVTFDLFDTLVQWTSCLDERHERMWMQASRVCKSFGLSLSPSAFADVRDRFWYSCRQANHSRGKEFRAVDVLESVVHAIVEQSKKSATPFARSQVAVSKTVSKIAKALERAFIKVDAETIVSMPDARETLSQLRRAGYRIALISNHPYDTCSIDLILNKCLSHSLIDKEFVSSSVGWLKSSLDPRSTIFRQALAYFDVEPGHSLHVGNEPDADYKAPRKLGMHAILCDNRQSFSHVVPNIARPYKSKKYKLAAIEAFRLSSQSGCRRYYGLQSTFSSDDCESAGVRLHELTRDVYAPLLITFSQDNLRRLRENPGSLNLCIGRDGLSSFLIQRKLIELFPEEYGSIAAKQVQYINISRQLVLSSSRDLMSQFLYGTGFFAAKSVALIDNGIVGTIQNVLHDLYPEVTLSGRYLVSRRLITDNHRLRKSGFLVETDCEWRSGQLCDLRFVGGKAEPSVAWRFLTPDFIHQQEDLWNGIYESPGKLVRENGLVRPNNLSKKIDYVPGQLSQLQGLSAISDYLVIKKLALRGLVEGVRLYRRQRELGFDYGAEAAIAKFLSWFSRSEVFDGGGGFDSRLLRALVRGVPQIPNMFDLTSDGVPLTRYRLY